MSKRILHVGQSAYRGTLEEQDDTILWLVQALKGAGASCDLLLRGNAVNYLVRGQDASGLAFGDKKQTHPPAIDDDVARIISKGIEVHYVAEDAEDRGLLTETFVVGARPVNASALPQLFEGYDQVWHW
jgi:sulfur relay (sulfurtransferase) DsrF/TusC family protein